jgi:hypothetical protein
VKEEADGEGAEGFSYRFLDFLVSLCISHQKTPAVCPGDSQTEAFPLFNGTIEAEKVFHPFPDGKNLFTVGSVKIDDQNLISGHQEVFDLKISMIKTSLMKLS